MPYVVYCPRGIVWLFDFEYDENGEKSNKEIARAWLSDHAKTCGVDEPKHLILPAFDPFEMNGI